jgi:predicted  nucleic acid-binding Zn-ribbon protein
MTATHKCTKCGWAGTAGETRKEAFGMGCPACWMKRGQYIPVKENKPQQAKGWKI